MGKKKKTYVKPEMKIIEVKTEGVIAASEIEINEDIYSRLQNSCVKGSLNQIGNCMEFTLKYPGCPDDIVNFLISKEFNSLDYVKICKKYDDGQFKYTIEKVVK